MNGLRVNRSLIIPEAEIEISFTTSGGPGGQHANKASTRVDLRWNIEGSAVLNERQRTRIRGALRRRIDGAGNLRLSADTHRSQLRNRRDAEDRLVALVAEALTPRKHRVGTKPTRAARERRLQDKKHRGEIKRLRQQRHD